MSVSFTAIFAPVVVATGILSAGAANAQYGYGYGNPSTGAGSTMPYQQPYQAQRQQQATYQAPTYRPSVTTQGNQFTWSPELGNWVPTRINPQVAQKLGDSVTGCAGAGAMGYVTGGPVKAGIYCVAGGFGISPGQQLLKTPQAY